MANSLFPAFLRVFWHSLQGAHVMTLPTRTYTPPSVGFPSGQTLNWQSNLVDTETMLITLLEQMADFVPVDTHFDSAIAYTMADETAVPLPRVVIPLDVDGAGATGTPAAQATYIYRTSLFGLSKLTFFDCAVNSNFLPITDEGSSPGQPRDLGDVWRDDEWGWAGRDGGQPGVFLRATFTLNEALRKKYRTN